MRQAALVAPLAILLIAGGCKQAPEAVAAQEPAGGWELGTVALVLGAWCAGGLLLCLATFRWTTRRDG